MPFASKSQGLSERFAQTNEITKEKTMTQTATSKDTCIQNCHECQVTCAQTLSEHCLKAGGDHTQQHHVKAMLDCIAACAASVDFMSRNSDHHALYCKACAEVCRALTAVKKPVNCVELLDHSCCFVPKDWPPQRVVASQCPSSGHKFLLEGREKLAMNHQSCSKPNEVLR